jgi:hypothetical protein
MMSIDIRNRNDQLLLAGAGAGILAAGFIGLRLARNSKPRSGPHTPDSLPKGAYDTIIVGAGKIWDALIVQGRLPETCSPNPLC